jgi:MOSC domain-containing protein YiiM
MEIVSLNVALPSTQRYGNREVFTGGAKNPVPRAMLRASGFEGDGQGDRRNHGGPDKAVCVYSSVHYPHWQRMLGRKLDPGAFSENLTVSGVREARVCVGDVFRAGEAVVQVSTPRTPCDKVAGKNGEKQLPKWISGSGYTGFYMRVLEEGLVETGDAFERVERHPDGITIARVNDVLYGRFRDLDLIEHLVGLPEFGDAGRAAFARLLGKVRRERVGES